MEYDGSEVLALACGHFYCVNCWAYYLETQINEGPFCIFTTCIDPKCNYIVPEEVFSKVLSPEVNSNYLGYMEKSSIIYNPLVIITINIT